MGVNFEEFIVDPDKIFYTGNFNEIYVDERKFYSIGIDELNDDWKKVEKHYILNSDDIKNFRKIYDENIELSISEILFLSYSENQIIENVFNYPKYWYFNRKLIPKDTLKKLFEYGYLRFATYDEKLKVVNKNNLQDILKYNALKITGTKQVLINRILENSIDIEQYTNFLMIVLTGKGKEVLSEYEYIIYWKNNNDISLEILKRIYSNYPNFSKYEIMLFALSQSIKKDLIDNYYNFLSLSFYRVSTIYKTIGELKKSWEYNIISVYLNMYKDELKSVHILYETKVDFITRNIGEFWKFKKEYGLSEEYIIDCLNRVEKLFPIKISEKKRQERIKNLFESYKNFLF